MNSNLLYKRAKKGAYSLSWISCSLFQLDKFRWQRLKVRSIYHSDMLQRTSTTKRFFVCNIIRRRGTKQPQCSHVLWAWTCWNNIKNSINNGSAEVLSKTFNRELLKKCSPPEAAPKRPPLRRWIDLESWVWEMRVRLTCSEVVDGRMQCFVAHMRWGKR